ncbi:hypothetical protein ACLOJK_007770 [Asimina triloba]
MSHSLCAGIQESSHHEPPTSIQEGNGLERSITIGNGVLSAGSSDFSHGEGKGVGFSEAATVERIEEVAGEENPSGVGVDGGVESLPPLFLAIGIGNSGEGDGTTISTPTEDSSGVEGPKNENYYRQLVEEQPCNGLYLRHYARFLYQAKQDLEKAEEYYSRAILSRPGDGEALSEYAKLIWERHHDYERSLCYFEQAAEVAPDDSHVLAAYAHFLWIAEEFEQGKEDGSQNECFVGLPLSSAMSHSLADGIQESSNYEPSTSTLETIPSFSVYNLRGEEGDGLDSSMTIQDRVLSTGSDFSFGEGKGVGFTEATAVERILEVEENPSAVVDWVESLPPLFLAKGLGIVFDDGNSGEGDGSIATPTEDSSGIERPKDENYYRWLVEEQPCNGLYLRDYARFLYQVRSMFSVCLDIFPNEFVLQMAS